MKQKERGSDWDLSALAARDRRQAAEARQHADQEVCEIERDEARLREETRALGEEARGGHAAPAAD